jgi:hypothetical protein
MWNLLSLPSAHVHSVLSIITMASIQKKTQGMLCFAKFYSIVDVWNGENFHVLTRFVISWSNWRKQEVCQSRNHQVDHRHQKTMLNALAERVWIYGVRRKLFIATIWNQIYPDAWFEVFASVLGDYTLAKFTWDMESTIKSQAIPVKGCGGS